MNPNHKENIEMAMERMTHGAKTGCYPFPKPSFSRLTKSSYKPNWKNYEEYFYNFENVHDSEDANNPANLATYSQ